MTENFEKKRKRQGGPLVVNINETIMDPVVMSRMVQSS